MIKERYRRSTFGHEAPCLRPTFDDFHRLRMEGTYEYPRHRHSNYEVILIERGPYRCELNGEELTLVDGQVLVVKPGDWHCDHLRDGQLHYVIHFRLLPLEVGGKAPTVFDPEVEAAGQVCQGNYTRETWLVEELRREADQATGYAAAVQDCLLESLFWRVVRGLPATSLSTELRRLPQEEHRRERLLASMNRWLRVNPSVEEMARELNMSPRHLTSSCRQLCGESPARLLLRLKLAHADDLLRYSELRVKQVSDSLGFANPYHFSRVYRRHFGHPPSRRDSIEGANGRRLSGRVTEPLQAEGNSGYGGASSLGREEMPSIQGESM